MSPVASKKVEKALLAAAAAAGIREANLVITTKIENFQLPAAIPHAENHNAPTVMALL